MNKVVAVLALTALVAGCKSSSSYTQTADLSNLRCFAYWDDKSISSLEVSYIRDLSKSGNLPCTIMLGDLYEKGRGVPQDISKAKALYQSVADKDPGAYGQLGRMAEEGIGGPVNDFDARQYYQRAVSKPEQRRSEAKLAKYMEEGRGGPQDLQGALTHYFNATQYLGDASWQGIERLRGKGLALTIEQQQRYNKIFVGSVQSGLRKRVEVIEKSLENNVNSTSASKSVQVQLEYTPAPWHRWFRYDKARAISPLIRESCKPLATIAFPATRSCHQARRAIRRSRLSGRTVRARCRGSTRAETSKPPPCQNHFQACHSRTNSG